MRPLQTIVISGSSTNNVSQRRDRKMQERLLSSGENVLIRTFIGLELFLPSSRIKSHMPLNSMQSFSLFHSAIGAETYTCPKTAAA